MVYTISHARMRLSRLGRIGIRAYLAIGMRLHAGRMAHGASAITITHQATGRIAGGVSRVGAVVFVPPFLSPTMWACGSSMGFLAGAEVALARHGPGFFWLSWPAPWAGRSSRNS